MRIGFTGAGGTGKSTVLNRLKDLGKFTGVPSLPSVMSEVMAHNNVTSDTNLLLRTAEERKKFQCDAWQFRRMKEEQFNQNFISDRTLLDHLAYIITTGGIDDLPRIPDVADIMDREDLYLSTTQANMMLYDQVFFFPINVFHQVDHRRSSIAYHRTLEALIKYFLDFWQIPYWTVVMPDLQSRANFIYRHSYNV